MDAEKWVRDFEERKTQIRKLREDSVKLGIIYGAFLGFVVGVIVGVVFPFLKG